MTEELEDGIESIAEALAIIRKNSEALTDLIDAEDFHESNFNHVVKEIEKVIEHTARAESKAYGLKARIE